MAGPAGGVAARGGELRQELMSAMSKGQGYEYLPLAGQSAGAVDNILPAADIVRRIISEAEEMRGRQRHGPNTTGRERVLGRAGGVTGPRVQQRLYSQG